MKRSMVVGMSKKKKAGEKLREMKKSRESKVRKNGYAKRRRKIYCRFTEKKSRDAKKTKSTGTKSVMSDAQKKGKQVQDKLKGLWS